VINFIYVICEGQSERGFVEHVLSPYIQEKTGYQWYVIPYVVVTSSDRKRGRTYRGGLTEYQKPKNDIIRCLKNGRYVTTMFDFFRLPKDFPGYTEAMALSIDRDGVEFIESKLSEDIKSELFIPYIQLHEFETLFFCDLDALKAQYVGMDDQIDALKSDVKGLLPEMINHGPETAPSKRLANYFSYEKGNEVMLPLKKIGIDKMKEMCPHFSTWIERIDKICGV